MRLGRNIITEKLQMMNLGIGNYLILKNLDFYK